MSYVKIIAAAERDTRRRAAIEINLTWAIGRFDLAVGLLKIYDPENATHRVRQDMKRSLRDLRRLVARYRKGQP